MWCISIFPSVMAMLSNFPIIYTFREFFLRFFFHKYNILLRLDVILILLLLTVAFFLFKINYIFLRVLLKKYKTFSYNLFHDIKCACFPYDEIPKLLTLNIHKEYVHLFLLLNIFLDYLHIHLFF